jgi:site-specific DNA recombinase
MRAALYCRLSTSTETNQPGLDAQLTELRALADARDWQVVAEITETASAFENVGGRPGFIKLAGLVRDGAVDVVAARHPDRFSRDEVEAALFRRDCRQHGVTIATALGDVAPDSPTDQLLGTITGAVGQYESAVRRQRMKAKHADLARRGKSSGGGSRAFGYNLDDTLNIVEAEHVRAVAKNVLAGASLLGESRRLAGLGVIGTRGGAITAGTLGKMLGRARISGRREHHGEVVADGDWPAIITPEESDTLRAMLSRRRRGPSRRSYLLTGGTVRCGKCGSPMVGQPHRDKRRYACIAVRGGCNRCFVNAWRPCVGSRPARRPSASRSLAATSIGTCSTPQWRSSVRSDVVSRTGSQPSTDRARSPTSRANSPMHGQG